MKDEVKRLEFELAKAQADTEARLLAEKEDNKGRIEAAKVAMVEAFYSSVKFCDIKADFASASYLQGARISKKR